jgi:phosphate:Na+ symporter
VGLAHFIFNVVTGVVALILALPLLSFLQKQFGITNPLSALVAFHLSFNLLGALMFLPFLKPFERFLMGLFSKEGPKTMFIHSVPSEVPEMYLIACHKEVHALQQNVIQFQMQTLRSFGFAEALPEFYSKLKQWEDEILKGLSQLQVQSLDEEESLQLDRTRIQLRSLAESAKSAKDVIHNLQQLEQSLESSHEKFLEKLKQEYSVLFEELGSLNGHKEEYLALIEKNSGAFERINQWIYSLPLQADHDQEIPLGTLLNVNREFYQAISLQLKAQI